MKHEQLGEEILGSWNAAENTEKKLNTHSQLSQEARDGGTASRGQHVQAASFTDIMHRDVTQSAFSWVWEAASVFTLIVLQVFPASRFHKREFYKGSCEMIRHQRWLWPSGMMTRAQFLGLACERRAMTPMTSHGVLGPPCFHRSAHMPPLLRMIW